MHIIFAPIQKYCSKMEDEFEDRILYQTYISHMKLLSKYGVGLPLNTAFLSYIWRLLRMYIVRPEIIILSTILCVIFLYLQTVDLWSRRLYFRTVVNFDKTKGISGSGKLYEGQSWELKKENFGVYSVQGRRARMEDRFVINEDINNSGLSLFAIFDGHGGEFAADYAKDVLIKNLCERLVEVKNYKYKNLGEGKNGSNDRIETNSKSDQNLLKLSHSKKNLQKKNILKKMSSTDEYLSKSSNIELDPYQQKIFHSLSKPIIENFKSNFEEIQLKKTPLQSYLDSTKFSGVDYGKIITDEVLAADRQLIDIATRNRDVSGSTALIAILEGSHLVVANVGDSRGVMCDGKGNAIPLSFDHKPQQLKESKRIKEAGGFITFNGVWRVAGILATSRALGDYPLKHKNLVIADPDVLTFNLSDHKPHFIILASDGLWDTFSNEEAVAFTKDHLDEPYYGAKSIALHSYYRGSYDNITVIIINLKDSKWSSYSIK